MNQGTRRPVDVTLADCSAKQQNGEVVKSTCLLEAVKIAC